MNRRLWQRLESLARKETAGVLRSLPDELRSPAAALPVIYEALPSAEIAEELGCDDLLGLFVGVPHGMTDARDPLPAQILLFLENLWDYAEGSEAAFRDEVRVTFLHELGHYLGLDEDEVEERGL